MTVPSRDHQGPEIFQKTELPGASPRQKQYTSITGRHITSVNIQNRSKGFIIHTTAKKGPSRLLEFT